MSTKKKKHAISFYFLACCTNMLQPTILIALMATLSSPLSSPLPLDATPNPTSPMSVLIPSPAATSPSPLPASRYLPATVSGRCKAQHWCQDTPPSGKSGDGATPLSFKEVLLAAIPAAPAGSSSPPVSPSRNAAPRILLHPSACCRGRSVVRTLRAG